MLWSMYRIHSYLAAKQCFAQGYVMLRYYVVTLSSNSCVSLNVESNHKMAIFALLHIITLVSFMFELYSGVMFCEPGSFYYFFHSFFDKSSPTARLARIND